MDQTNKIKINAIPTSIETSESEKTENEFQEKVSASKNEDDKIEKEMFKEKTEKIIPTPNKPEAKKSNTESDLEVDIDFNKKLMCNNDSKQSENVTLQSSRINVEESEEDEDSFEKVEISSKTSRYESSAISLSRSCSW